MKMFYRKTLLSLSLLVGAGLSAQAQVPVGSIESGKAYYIVSAGSRSITSTGGLYTDGTTATYKERSEDDDNYKWIVYQPETDGSYYLYNVGAKVFLNAASAASTQWPTSSWPEAMTLTVSDNNASYLNIHSALYEKDATYAHVDASFNIVGWYKGDANSDLYLLEATDITADELSEAQSAMETAAATGYTNAVSEANSLSSSPLIGVLFGYKQENVASLTAAIPSAAPSDFVGYADATYPILQAIDAFTTDVNLPENGSYYRFKYDASNTSSSSYAGYYIGVNGTKLTLTETADNSYTVFQAETDGDGVYYFKSAATNEYMGIFSGYAWEILPLVSTKAEAGTFTASVTTAPVAMWHNSNNSLDFNGYAYISLSGMDIYSSNTGYWTLEEVAAEDIQVSYNYTVNITDANGVVRKTITGTVPAGTVIDAPTFSFATQTSSLSESDLTIDSEGKVITIAYDEQALPFTATTVENGAFVNPTWYKLTLRGSSDNSNPPLYVGHVEGETSYALATDASATNSLDYLWCITGDAFSGVSLYNAATGTSQTLTLVGSNPIMQDGVAIWDITTNSNDANGFSLKVGGSANQYINDFQGKKVLGIWNAAGAANDDGSCFRLVANPSIDEAIDALGYVTRCYPFNADLTAAKAAGMKVYAVSNVDVTAGQATLTEFDGDVLAAGEGVILYAPSAGNYTISVTTTDGTTPATNSLIGTLNATTLDAGSAYVLAATENNDGVEFALLSDTDAADGGNVVPANHAYLPAGAANFISTLSFTFGTPTAIESATVESDEDVTWYTLGGVAVQNPSKGIYVNSKGKVVLFK